MASLVLQTTVLTRMLGHAQKSEYKGTLVYKNTQVKKTARGYIKEACLSNPYAPHASDSCWWLGKQTHFEGHALVYEQTYLLWKLKCSSFSIKWTCPTMRVSTVSEVAGGWHTCIRCNCFLSWYIPYFPDYKSHLFTWNFTSEKWGAT